VRAAKSRSQPVSSENPTHVGQATVRCYAKSGTRTASLTLMAITELPVRFAGDEISWCRHRLLKDRKKPQLHLSRYCQQPIDCYCPSPPCESFAAAHVGCKEPPIERSEALRDAPVFGSSPLGGSSPRGRALIKRSSSMMKRPPGTARRTARGFVRLR
jgi:hypothetical protein